MAAARSRPNPGRRGKGCAFGPPEVGTLLTFVGSRWKLWREAPEEQDAHVSHNDPSESYVCAAWGSAGADHRFALGCASGRVQAWDSRSGEGLGPTAEAFASVVRGADCAVAAVALSSAQRGTVFVACQAVPQVLEVGIADGVVRGSFKAGKLGLVQLASTGMGADDWLISACPGSALKVWHLKATSGGGGHMQETAKLAGPAETSTSLSLRCQSGRLLALCADGTTQVDVFSLDASAPPEGKQPAGAAIVLSAHEPILTAQFTDLKFAEGRASVLGCGPTAAACWSFRPDRAGRGSGKTVMATFVVLAAELGGRFIAARPAVGASIVVAFGALAAPAFAAAKASPEGGAVVEPLAGSGTATLAKHSATATAPAGVGRKRTHDVAQPKVLGPMEAVVPRKQPRRDGAVTGEGALAKERAQLLPQVGKAVAGLSIAPVVRQSLRAKDGVSMQAVFNYGDRKVIDCTVAELSGVEAFDLLQECTKRFLTDPVRAPLLCVWVQRVLLRHCAFIFSQPAMHQALLPLNDVLKSRCSSHRTLLRMRGRLQTLRACGKLSLERSKQTTPAAEASASAPLLEYVEGDEDGAEEEAGEDGSMVDVGSCEGVSDDDDFGEESDDDVLID